MIEIDIFCQLNFQIRIPRKLYRPKYCETNYTRKEGDSAILTVDIFQLFTIKIQQYKKASFMTIMPSNLLLARL